MFQILIIFIGGLLFSYPAYSATLTALKVKSEKGKLELTLPVEFDVEASERVSGIQFDIIIPSGMKITNMLVGSSAQKANKMVSFNQIKRQTYRTIVAGLNQEPIQGGTILLINIAIENQELAGKQLINLENPVLADPEGNSVPCTVIPGEIFFTGNNEEIAKQDKNLPDTNDTSPISSEREKQGIFKLKNIGLAIIVIVIALVLIAILVKKMVSIQSSNTQITKLHKKTKKKKN